MTESSSSEVEKIAKPKAVHGRKSKTKKLPKARGLVPTTDENAVSREFWVSHNTRLGTVEQAMGAYADQAKRLDNHLARITKLENSHAGAMWWVSEIALIAGVVYLLMAKFGVLP